MPHCYYYLSTLHGAYTTLLAANACHKINYTNTNNTYFRALNRRPSSRGSVPGGLRRADYRTLLLEPCPRTCRTSRACPRFGIWSRREAGRALPHHPAFGRETRSSTGAGVSARLRATFGFPFDVRGRASNQSVPRSPAMLPELLRQPRLCLCHPPPRSFPFLSFFAYACCASLRFSLPHLASCSRSLMHCFLLSYPGAWAMKSVLW